MNDINRRIVVFEILFDKLMSTSGRNDKLQEIKFFKKAYPQYVEDLTYILETLDNRHPIGWTFTPCMVPPVHWNSIKEMIQACERCPSKAEAHTMTIERSIGSFGDVIAPIVNRTLRLGIGKSLLGTTDITPMLAKAYRGENIKGDIIVTEKLDGNRCIAYYDGEKWRFKSRSSKDLNVNIDMTGMDTNYIYDGELMSREQTDLSLKRTETLANTAGTATAKDVIKDTMEAQKLFNETSGLINSKGEKSGLVYNIFDIVCDDEYTDRRSILNHIKIECSSSDIRFLPILYSGRDKAYIKHLLDEICYLGGEGLMLNSVDRSYEHKRTNALLKYKKVKFLDMQVTGILPGTGKYEGLVGALECAMVTEDGKHISCDVGSGLSDDQRMEWHLHPERIFNKIVQIGYHELTQNSETYGTNLYSVRFPRLISVRWDKDCTSEY